MANSWRTAGGNSARRFIVRIRLQFFANDAELEVNYAAIIRLASEAKADQQRRCRQTLCNLVANKTEDITPA